MTNILVILIPVHCILLSQGFAEDKKYTTKYDNIDVDSVINSSRLLNKYVDCLLDRGPCPPDAAELKKNLPDALEHNCQACSEVQKQVADKISQYLIDHRPDYWNLLEEKYDPTGEYRKRYVNEKSKQQAID